MRPLLVTVFLALLVLTPASVALAHHPADAADPRCAEWLAAPDAATRDLAAVCAARQATGATVRPTDAGRDDGGLVPYVAAAVVTGMGLALVGLVALRLGPGASRRRSPGTASRLHWWRCPACAAVNGAARPTCYACGSLATP